MPKLPYTKPALSIDQQIDQLLDRGMVIKNRPHATHFLSQINYYRLSAYWLPFEEDNKTHTFKKDTHFELVLDLYSFDRELRLLVLDAIERIEVAIRTTLAFQLSHRYGTHPHLDAELFYDNGVYLESLNRLQKDVTQSKEVFIQYLLENYSEALPPIWAVVELMSLGQLSKWYANLKSRSDRNLIAHKYNFDDLNLVSFLHLLTIVRNLCAHHSRLWNREFRFSFKIPKRRPDDLVEDFNQSSQKRIYNTLVMMLYLMDKISPDHHWRKRLIEKIDQHQIDTTRMGFPADWKTKAIWR